MNGFAAHRQFATANLPEHHFSVAAVAGAVFVVAAAAKWHCWLLLLLSLQQPQQQRRRRLLMVWLMLLLMLMLMIIVVMMMLLGFYGQFQLLLILYHFQMLLHSILFDRRRPIHRYPDHWWLLEMCSTQCHSKHWHVFSSLILMVCQEIWIVPF